MGSETNREEFISRLMTENPEVLKIFEIAAAARRAEPHVSSAQVEAPAGSTPTPGSGRQGSQVTPVETRKA